MTIVGRDGLTLEELWKKDGAHKETPEEFNTMLAYQAKMERDGQKFLGGALNDEAGKRSGGIVIVRASTWAVKPSICRVRA